MQCSEVLVIAVELKDDEWTWNKDFHNLVVIFILLYTTFIYFVKQYHFIRQQRKIHLYKHTKNCYIAVESLFLNSSDRFLKLQTVDITVSVGLSN